MLQEAETRMKRVVLLILVLLLLVDLAEAAILGKANFYLPNPSAKTSVTSSHNHPGSGQNDFRHELASQNLPGHPRHGDARTVSLHVPPTLQIMHCSHLSSSGGLPT
jgi:hypothetical protein